MAFNSVTSFVLYIHTFSTFLPESWPFAVSDHSSTAAGQAQTYGSVFCFFIADVSSAPQSIRVTDRSHTQHQLSDTGELGWLEQKRQYRPDCCCPLGLDLNQRTLPGINEAPISVNTPWYIRQRGKQKVSTPWCQDRNPYSPVICAPHKNTIRLLLKVN